jgi:hypothetical protein
LISTQKLKAASAKRKEEKILLKEKKKVLFKVKIVKRKTFYSVKETA